VNVRAVAAVADTALAVPAGDALLAPVPAFTSVPVGAVAESASMTHLTFSERLSVIERTSDVPVMEDWAGCDVNPELKKSTRVARVPAAVAQYKS
jgi:hypothetical protein